MGYMGLTCVCDSDAASDLAYGAAQAAAKVLQKDVKSIENGFNTDGCVNVALFIEEFVIPTGFGDGVDEMGDVAQTALELLQKKLKNDFKDVEDWGGDKENMLEHKEAYERLVKALVTWLEGD